jgi:DNA mismatch repair protein MutL
MPIIRQLSPSVINKIAAGEVIERPASVVKELMENAVDARATRVDVAIEKGGTQAIRVVDNGCGIEAEQLALALASHATSKLADADDLYRIGTLGFRGEALASIAEISRLEIRSRAAGRDGGARIEAVGGRIEPVEPCGAPTGTQIEVRDLFFNTPVRRKFMRAIATEAGHAAEAFTRLALAHPHVHFTLRHNDRLQYDLPADDDPRRRVAKLLGDELADDLIAIDSREGEFRIHGFVANPSHSRGNARLQYLLLNGRAIRDRALQHALGEAYRGLLLTGRYPIAVLHLELPPESVDVNVHPTKAEVRFEDGGRLYRQLLAALRMKFLSTDLTAQGNATAGLPAVDLDRDDGLDAAAAQRAQSELVDWAKGRLGEARAELGYQSDGRATGEQRQFAMNEAPRAPLELNRLSQSWSAGDDERKYSDGSGEIERHDRPHAARPSALQVHNRYLIAENDDGMIVIDQHALHERILYEQIREKTLAGKIESQALLVPEPLDLAPAEAAAALEHKETLAQLGIAIEPFGGDTILVSGYPAMLANIEPGRLVRDVIEQLVEEGKTPERRDLIDSLLHMISCKAAIKAGDRLAPEEIDALLSQRHLAQDAHHCPHGRPTALVFTREQLDRQFKRT